MKIFRYEDKQKSIWDEFITNSKNGDFLFYRDYMDYHSDRFEDFSLMFFDDNRLLAIMPANIKDDIIVSHGGLTYGGIISDRKMKTSIMLKMFDDLEEYLKKEGIKKLIYKAMPHIYHTIPAEEDLYALFLHNAKLFRRDAASSILLKEKLSFSRGTRSWIKKSKKENLEIKRSYDFDTFMNIEENVLQQKYDVKPTHTSEEIQLLAKRFPENIKLFGVFKNDEMIAGTIMYEYKNVAHAQYSGSNNEGKQLGASHFLFGYLINDHYNDKKYFDFGISTEKNGKYLNLGLIDFKERLGARGITYDFYEMSLS